MGNNAVGTHTEKPARKRAPTLYGIIVFKLVKGAVFIILAFFAYRLSNKDLPAEFQNVLQFFRIQPDTRFWFSLAEHVDQLTEAKMLWAAAGLFVYSLFALVEGIGLCFRVSWAGWLAIGESIFFIPLEYLELRHRFSWGVVAVMVINIVICWYLLCNRRRLFRHHLR
jgi:uncharacterized membrane protein (DUF2068 family)